MIKRETAETAWPKLKLYCAYQERCHGEVREKLYAMGVYKNEAEQLMARLIEENNLNEERFAIQYAGGKFRINHWGKIKIRHALKQKGVSDYCVRKALAQIPEEDYRHTLSKLAAQKLALLKKEKNIFTRKRKLQDYLLQKGYEMELINTISNEL